MPGFNDHVGQEVGEKYLRLVELGMPPLPPGVKYERGFCCGWTAWDVTPEPEHGGIGITEELATGIVIMHGLKEIHKTDSFWFGRMAQCPPEMLLTAIMEHYAVKAGS